MHFHRLRSEKHGFTLVEMLVATGIFTIFAATLLTSWLALQSSAVNMTAYAQRQCDQMRVIDYLKRDVRRASAFQIYSAGVPVAGTGVGDEIRVTIPDYYADSRAEDDVLGTRIPNTPTYSAGAVSYGVPLTVRYFVLNGAIIRQEGGASVTLAESAGHFVLTVNREISGDLRGRVFFDQVMRGGTAGRTLRRQVEFLCGQRVRLQS